MATINSLPDELIINHYNQDALEFKTYVKDVDDSDINFTGSLLVAQLKINKTDSVFAYEFRSDNGTIVLEDSGKRLVFYISTEDITPLAPGTYVGDLQQTIGTDNFTLFTITLNIIQDVTRP